MSVSREDLYRFIRQRKLGVVSSMSDASTPQSALIGIAVTPDLEIIFDTTKSTRKYSNLIVRPQCSLVIGWEAEQTLQYEGRAEELQPPDLARYQEIYFQAWPDCRAPDLARHCLLHREAALGSVQRLCARPSAYRRAPIVGSVMNS